MPSARPSLDKNLLLCPQNCTSSRKGRDDGDTRTMRSLLVLLTVLVATAGLRVPPPSMMGRAENRKAAAKAAKAAKKKKASGGASSSLVTPAAALGLTPAEYQARVDSPPVQAPAEPSAPMDDFAFVPKVMDDVGLMDDGGLMAEFQARVANPPAQTPSEPAAPPVRAPTERERSFLQDSPHNRGMALMAEGNYEYAGLEFEKALDLNNDALDTWSALGVCMSELAQPEAALVCQRQVLRLQALAGEREAQSEAELRELASEAAALPTLPDGKQLALASGRLAEADTGGTVWSCAPVLCRWLKREAAGVCASAVLELGCGTGAVGLYAAGLGARRVVMTDGGPPAVLELARANEAANRQMWRAQQLVEVRPLAWGEAPAATEEGGGGGGDVLGEAYDWVLGSDVTYSPGAHAPLCATIADVLSRAGAAGRATRAVLAHEHRVSDDAAADVRLEHFQEAAATAGLSVAILESELEGERRVSVLQLSLKAE